MNTPMTWDPIAARVKTAEAERSPELEALAAKWQEILGIQEWRVRVRLTRGFDMKGGTTEIGSVDMQHSVKEAVIDIIHPEDIDPDTWGLWPERCDQETILVHELVHVLFAPFGKTEGLKHDAQEFAVNTLSMALVKLSREAKEEARTVEAIASTARADVEAARRRSGRL